MVLAAVTFYIAILVLARVFDSMISGLSRNRSLRFSRGDRPRRACGDPRTALLLPVAAGI